MRTATALTIWVFAMAVSGIYLLPPGMPQPADMLMLVVVALMFFSWGNVNHTFALLCLAWFAWVLVVNAAWWSIHPDHRFLMSAAYCGFNLLAMVTTVALMLRRPDDFVVWGRRAILVALMIEVVAVVALLRGPGIADEELTRTAGTFNNPNQLAYWSLLIASCWLALKPREPLDFYDLGVIVTAVALCVAVSGSRAGALGVAALLGVAVAFHGVRAKWLPAVALAGLVAIGSAGYWAASLSEQPAIERFGQERKHDTIAARGYDRIWLFPEYLIAGAGEGAFRRFAHLSEGGGNLEIHSTPATILFGYGIVGSSILGVLLWWVFRGADWRHIAYLAPPMVYGLTHNGIRATLLWIVLGIVFGFAQLRSNGISATPKASEAQPVPEDAGMGHGATPAMATLTAPLGDDRGGAPG